MGLNGPELTAKVGGEAGPGGVVARPALFGRLDESARVTMLSAPAGSGKTVLLRSWISQRRLAGRAAYVAAGREERDPQRFWLSVVTALRATAPGAGLVGAVTGAPGLDGQTIAEQLLGDLAGLEDELWLVVDDVHELGEESLRQLELLVMRAPQGLRFVLAARHDVRLGLHRLRLDGELTEIRDGDLRFSLAEAGELLATAGTKLPPSALAGLHQRTEGWAAGLRLAALSLAGHPDPERFAAEFSGTERTVAEYLLAEVLDRQPAQVRMLLLRTSILERVNGELASLLTGAEGAERILQDLEAAGAFVVSLDATRSWFRYHQMFAGLLRLELRRTEPGAVAGLHRAAAEWLAGHGYLVEAVRQAQDAEGWDLAAQLLTDHWPALHLDGQASAVHELLAGFPSGLAAADAGLAAVAAADELARGSLEAAEGYLGQAQRGSQSVPEARRGQVRLLLGLVGLLLARQRADLPAVTEQAARLEAMVQASGAGIAVTGLGEDLRALALISLGIAEFWADAPDDARPNLERGIALARQIRRPYLEFTGLAYLAATNLLRSTARAVELGTQAVELAERHGWASEPAARVASVTIGAVLAYQVRPAEAEPWVQRAERFLSTETEPAVVLAIRYVRGVLELARGRTTQALAAFEAGVPLSRHLASRHYLLPPTRELLVHSLLRLGETDRAARFLTGLNDSDEDRSHGTTRNSTAALRLAQGDPQAATAALAPVLDGTAPLAWPARKAQAFLLEAIAREALGDQAAAETALERALDLAEPDGVLLPFLLYPAPGLFERHVRHRTAHASLIAEIQTLLLAGTRPARSPTRPEPLREPLSGSEVRVLRYLPTNLTTPEIARELSVSTNTVKTHIRNLYAKLGTHRRAEAVETARALGLLAPSRTAAPA
ncbi:LuxR C-terminal-related transcriptional regulator [Nonomuraea helvata]|uniref:LuxR C-terminal-related transcriptional regulator n=1 Tax=Nonomuraea helvata TaxID=37484 RepID=A0ABV5RTK4_9ACTN